VLAGVVGGHLLGIIFHCYQSGFEVKIGVKSIFLALSFLVKKGQKGRVFAICLFLKEFFV